MKMGEFGVDIAPSPGMVFVPLVKESHSEVRLVCFHFAGGSAQSFLSWRQPSAGLCELLAGELPGRGRHYGESFSASILDAAERFADVYEKLQPKKSVFYGHSLGSLLAYETSRALIERGGAGPNRLVVSSRSGPVGFPVSIGLPELSDASLMEYLRHLQGTKQSVLENKMLMKMMLPIIRADLQIIYGYEHRRAPLLDIPVDVIGAIGDRHCPFESLLDWRNVTKRGFNLLMVPGGHFAPIAHPGIVLDIVSDLKSEISHEAFI